MTATAERKTKGKKTKLAKPAANVNGHDVLGEAIAARPKVGPSEAVRWSEIIQLRVDELQRHPANRVPTKEQIADLAGSMALKGQGDPIKVRPLPSDDVQRGASFQIVSGETRWLAAKANAWKEVDCRVGNLTDAQALEYLAEENGHRHDLTPIDKARLIAKLCEPAEAGGAGLTREKAAQRVGLESASAASNLVRLLELPESVQTLVAEGKVAESKARLLLPYKELPQLAEAILEDEDMDWNGPREYLEGDVWRTAHALTRPMSGEKRYDYQRGINIPSPAFKATDEQLAKLQVFDLLCPKSVGGARAGKTEPRAFNVKLWDELQKAAVEELIEKGEQKAKAKKAKEKTAKLTPAQEREKAEEQAAKLARRVHEWRINWLRMLLAYDFQNETEPADGRAIKFLAWALAGSTGYAQQDYLRAAAVKVGIEVPKDEWCDAWELIGQASADDCQRLACVLAALYLDPDATPHVGDLSRNHLPDELVEGLAADFSIDVEEDWRLTQQRPGLQSWFTSFVELHSKDQLIALAGEWKIKTAREDPLTSMKRSELVDLIGDTVGLSSKPYPLPACLVPAKVDKKTKRRRK